MPVYKAHFRFALKHRVACAVSKLPSVNVMSQPNSHMRSIMVEPIVVEGALTDLDVTATYDSPALKHLIADPSTGAIMVLFGESGTMSCLSPAYEITQFLLAPLLYQLSALTLQPYLYWNVFESLGSHVSNVTWTLPDHTTRIQVGGMLPKRMLVHIVDSGACAVEAKHFKALEEIFGGRIDGAPLWRAVLADAHRARGVGIREVVIHAATALDIGVQRHLPPKTDMDMRVFRGLGRTPNLGLTDPPLLRDIERLWYSRHAIVHQGRTELFERSPRNRAKSVGPLLPQHIEAFLVAVPKAIAFIEQNPP